MSEQVMNEVVENVADVVEPEIVEEAAEAVKNADVDFRFAPMVAAGVVTLTLIIGGVVAIPKAYRWGKKKIENAVESRKAKKTVEADVKDAKIYSLDEIANEVEKENEE